MDKNSAINLIKDTFNAKFDESKFTLFIKNFLNDLEPKSNSYSGNLLWDDYKEHISSYKRIGKYTDPEGDALDVLIVQVKTVTKLQKARTTLRNFVIKHLSKFDKDYALVAFYSKEDGGADWRFSFIKLEHQAYLDEEKQKVKTRKEFTPAKRYSFLVGEYEDSHTAKNQLLPLLQNIANNPTLEELETSFSIEKVTDEFFGQYKDLFVKLSTHFENDEHVKVELKKANIDNSRFTKKLLGQIVFLYFLQKKGWLGVPKKETWGLGDKRFIQNLYKKADDNNQNYFNDYLQPLFYEALAKERSNENSFYKKFNCRIPFLNGGLFEAEYNWQKANISIPEYLFRNEDKNKAGDTGTGVLDVFDRYNFTIKEDEPLDKEVAVDPEMLGKVFENMLDITERKSKGAFYTPREIVHYMCQESLIHYLDNSLENKIKKSDIETYIRKGHFALENDQRVANKGESKTYKYIIPESIRQNAELIDQKLSEIKILDPAIGSGAFPVGLLHELVNAQLVLKPHLSNKYLNKKLDGFGFQFHESINESRYVYRLKRHIIQESIYGVDIDASAIDIARLRLWLSLVVDEDDLDPIETLPNLDYKIVCGNSLIGMPTDIFPNLKIQEEIEELKPFFYNETNETKKKALRTQINTKIRELLDSAETFAGYKIDFDFKLYFSEVWHEKGGFDVVIGNPPYLNLTKNNFDNAQLKIFDKNYVVLRKAQSKNLFALFIELGMQLLNKNATISMIVPEGLAQTRSYTAVRKLFSQNKIDKLLTFKEFVFSQAVIGNVVFFTSPTANEVLVLNFINETKQTIRNTFTQEVLDTNPDYVWGLNKLHKVLGIIENTGTSLVNMNFTFSKGMVVKNRTEHLREIPQEKDLPFILGKNLSRYFLKYKDYTNYNELTIIGGTKKLEKHLITPRILIRRTGAEICASYSEKKELIESTCYIMSGNNLKSMVGILNSSPLNYYLKSKFITNQQGYPQILMNDLMLLPIKLPKNKIDFERIIDYLIFLGQSERKSSIEFLFFDSIVDALSFEAYFENEIIAANKEILKHLGDLKPITDKMSKEEKLAIIQSEFERLYDPNHPVRNNIETLDSIEEVRIIKEALK